MEEYIKAYEYEKNVNPMLNSVPILKKNIQDCSVGINFIDNGSVYNVDYKATSPNLLASFIVLDENQGYENDPHIVKFNRCYNRGKCHYEKEINHG
jgi:hypothetical protein